MEENFLAVLFPVGSAEGIIPGARQFGVQQEHSFFVQNSRNSCHAEINAHTLRLIDPTPAMNISAPDHRIPHYPAESFPAMHLPLTPSSIRNAGCNYLLETPTTNNKSVRRRLFANETPIAFPTPYPVNEWLTSSPFMHQPSDGEASLDCDIPTSYSRTPSAVHSSPWSTSFDSPFRMSHEVGTPNRATTTHPISRTPSQARARNAISTQPSTLHQAGATNPFPNERTTSYQATVHEPISNQTSTSRQARGANPNAQAASQNQPIAGRPIPQTGQRPNKLTSSDIREYMERNETRADKLLEHMSSIDRTLKSISQSISGLCTRFLDS